MRTLSLITTLIIFFISLNSCNKNNSTKKNKNDISLQRSPTYKNIKVQISGMTCEIGCAKIIESKMSKLKGVSFSKVSFADSIGIFTYDANMTNGKSIIAKINGIADGETYKVIKSQVVEKIFTE